MLFLPETSFVMFQFRVYSHFIIPSKKNFGSKWYLISLRILAFKKKECFQIYSCPSFKSSKVKSATSAAACLFSEDILFIYERNSFPSRVKIFNKIFVIRLMRIDFKINIFIVTKLIFLFLHLWKFCFANYHLKSSGKSCMTQPCLYLKVSITGLLTSRFYHYKNFGIFPNTRASYLENRQSMYWQDFVIAVNTEW